MRLKMVATVDFRKGVPTNLDELRKIGKLRSIADNEVILLISQTKLQLAFVYPDVRFEAGGRRGEIRAIAHYRVQLDRHTPWNPLMLVNYAEEAGLAIEGVKRFEDSLRAEVRALGKEWNVATSLEAAEQQVAH